MHQTKELMPELGDPRLEQSRNSAASHAASERKSGPPILGILAALILAGAIGYAIFTRMTAESALKKATQDSSALPVSVIHPAAVAPEDEISIPGSAQPFQSTSIYARTSGYLKSWKVDIGDHVKKGQILAEIETPEVDQQLEQARADLKNAQANLSLSQITAERSENLFKRSTISNQERDQAVSDLAAKRAMVDSGQANVRRLEQLQSFERVEAPFDGVITARSTDIGSLIQAGGSTSAKELFHIVDSTSLRVFFSVPEVYASSIKPGERVRITFDAFPGENFTGELVRDAAAIDPSSHTLNTEADVPNPTERLFAGGYTTVHLKLPPATGTVTIPANTLLFRSEGTRVAVVKDGRAVLTPVTISVDHGNSLEVLGALTTSDSVIMDPPDSLADGELVLVEKTDSVQK